MKNISRWACAILMPAFTLFGQEFERAPFDPTKSGVQVVFAPESRRAIDRTPLVGAGGAIGVRLGDQFMVGTMITVGKDGRLQLECAPLAEVARKFNAAKSASKEKTRDK